MAKESLSAEFVRNAVCKEGQQKTNYFDRAITGFLLEVRISGGKTYYLKYVDQHNRQRQYKIGDAKSVTFEKASQAALILRSRVVLGENPNEARQAKRNTPTLNEFSQRYLSFAKGYKRSWKADESVLRLHILPKWGRCHLDQVHQQSVTEFHHGIRAAGYAPATANRILIVLRYMYNLARKWKVAGAENNPTAGVAMLECNNARERYLSTEEARRLKAAVEQSDNPQLKYIVAMLLLTGARKRELLDSRWEHFDLESRDWRIPLSKNGKARHVPLSTAAMAILAQVPRFTGCPWVLPNPKTLKPFVAIYASWNTARMQAGLPDVVMHSLRHSFASDMISAGQSLFLVGSALGHRQIKSTARYSHLSQHTLLAAVDASANATGIDWGPAQAVKTGDNLALAAA